MSAQILFTVLVFFASPLWAASNADTSSANLTEVPVPCSDDQDSFLRKCSEVIPAFTTDLRQRIKNQVDKIYETGRMVDTRDPQDGCSARPDHPEDCIANSSTRFVKPVCSLTANSLNSCTEELGKNHLQESCGNFLQIQVDTNFKTVARASEANGARERAYYGGALVQAMAYYLKQVTDEIASKKLQLSAAPNGCRAMGADAASLQTQTRQITDELKKSLGDQGNVKDIANCKKEEWDSSNLKSGMDVGKLRQSSQYLCASRSAQESLFNQLMACEVFSRAQKDFLSVFKKLEELQTDINNTIGAQCNSECNSRCNSTCRGQSRCVRWTWHGPSVNTGGCRACGSECGTSCANTCYQAKLANFLKPKQQRWVSGSCQPITATTR